jgi:uncharacterized cupredoxin-like copper-binding protein
MTLSELSIRRPVLAAVVSLLIVVFGAASIFRIPVRELPDVDRPVVTVTTEYIGAAPEIIDADITEIIDSAVAGISGVKTISSESRTGRSRTTIEFIGGRDIDEAANDVRDAVGRVRGRLPEDAEEPRVVKSDADADPIMRVAVTSDRMSAPDITDYIERNIIDRLTTIDGVANVEIFGARRYAIRVWIDRRELAARNMTVADIEAALESPDLGGLFESAVSIGGPPSIDAGQRASVAMNLAPGEYVAVCAIPGEDGMPHYMMGMYSTFEVTARAGNALPVFSDTKITLVDHAFEGLPAEVAAGQNTWEVFNDGEQLHEFLVGRLSPGVTFDQVTQMLSEAPEASPAAAIEASPVPSPVASPSAGGPPFTLLAGAAPMSPGQTVWSVMDFEAGDYFAICFVPDPESGAPHFALGMIAPFTVT